MAKHGRLYKYCRVNENTLDALRNEYLYLCPADKLDDQFEGTINFSIDEFSNKDEFDRFQDKTIDGTIKSIADEFHTDKNIVSEAKSLLINKNIDDAFEELFRVYKTNPQEKFRIQSKLNEIKADMSSHEKEFDDFMLNLLEAREKIGIGSLTPFNDNQVMWTMYADSYQGVCIEYEIPDKCEDLFRVKYNNVRNLNPLVFVIKISIESAINNVDIKENIKKYLMEMITTKRADWSFQNEFRIMGYPNYHYPLKIKAIFLGKRISLENRNNILTIAREKGYEVYYQKDDFNDMKIMFIEKEQ
ncbi:MAG: DUF2971 domain-containing protein [Clostridia bacterium]|nr:DUF2971 domain-containing protein [Clostridia bacterium]